MKEAVLGLDVKSDLVLVDAFKIPELDIKQVPIIKGDRKSVSIAAASIVAKVTRDRMMVEYSKKYPEYGFKSNKGYGTKAHMDALREYGPCPIHRLSFLKFLNEE
jgi:ribonuclease HII